MLDGEWVSKKRKHLRAGDFFLWNTDRQPPKKMIPGHIVWLCLNPETMLRVMASWVDEVGYVVDHESIPVNPESRVQDGNPVPDTKHELWIWEWKTK